MRILLTGGTGFIGRAVLTRLRDRGDEVTALVRSESSAAQVREAGATAVVGDLFDSGWVGHQLATVEAAIHTAATGSAEDERLNASVLHAVERVYRGTPSTYLHTGGIWTLGSGSELTEESPAQPIPLTAWRVPQEETLLEQEIRATVIRPGIVYGYGRGLPGLISDGPRDPGGALRLIGDGRQHWTTVHVDDLADLYVHLLEASPGRQAYLGVGGDNPTVRELATAASGDVVPESVDASRERLGAPLADALLLDQQAAGAKARATGWTPSRPSLAALLADGYPTDR